MWATKDPRSGSKSTVGLSLALRPVQAWYYGAILDSGEAIRIALCDLNTVDQLWFAKF